MQILRLLVIICRLNGHKLEELDHKINTIALFVFHIHINMMNLWICWLKYEKKHSTANFDILVCLDIFFQPWQPAADFCWQSLNDNPLNILAGMADNINIDFYVCQIKI